MTYRETAPHSNARYSAFGLTIASQIELPELTRCDGDGPADVEIRVGEVDSHLDGAVEIEPGISAKPGKLLIDYEMARYLVAGGQEVIIAPKAGGSERDVRAFLLGSAMGAICHQRGLLPLHANAVEIAGRAVAFAGPSGAGKSTLAAHFRRGGRRLLCDDVCAVSFDSAGAPLAWPGIPRIKLWSDALAAFGRDASGLERVVDGEDKFSLPFTPDGRLGALRLDKNSTRLRRTDVDAPAGIRPLSGAEAVTAVLANIYRWQFAAPLGQSRAQFANVLALVGSTEVFAAVRDWGFDVFQAEAEALERHCQPQPAPSL